MERFRNTVATLKELLHSLSLDGTVLGELEEINTMIALKISGLKQINDDPVDEDISVPTLVDDLAEDMDPEPTVEDDDTLIDVPLLEILVPTERIKRFPSLTKPSPPQFSINEASQAADTLLMGYHQVTPEDISSQVSEIPPELSSETMELTYPEVDFYTWGSVESGKASNSTGKTRQMYVCGECEYETTSKHKMKDHWNVHSGDKPFKCLKCNYSAAGRGSLFNHMKTHEDQKVYKCAYCDQQSNRLDNMKRHISRKHKHIVSGSGVIADDGGTQIVHK